MWSFEVVFSHKMYSKTLIYKINNNNNNNNNNSGTFFELLLSRFG